jgi:CheY-like chemotaxis protein
MKEEKVLIIEDNELNRKLITSLLHLKNYQVLEAEDAETGIDMARKYLPDLILMDIQLPGMDGLTATRVLKNDIDLKNIPIVAVTSYAMSGDEDKAMAAGCVGYITKPIETREFIKSISEYIY